MVEDGGHNNSEMIEALQRVQCYLLRSYSDFASTTSMCSIVTIS